MTLEEGKRKVGILLDEYDNSVLDSNTEERMPDLFDMAQKIIADIEGIVKTYDVEPVSGTSYYAMPDDFLKVLRVWQDGEIVERQWIGKKIITTDAVTVEYAACPETIGPDTDETHEFEVSEIACQAMPFFVAANCIIVDLVNSPNALINEWNQRLSMIRQEVGGTQRRVRKVW